MSIRFGGAKGQRLGDGDAGVGVSTASSTAAATTAAAATTRVHQGVDAGGASEGGRPVLTAGGEGEGEAEGGGEAVAEEELEEQEE